MSKTHVLLETRWENIPGKLCAPIDFLRNLGTSEVMDGAWDAINYEPSTCLHEYVRWQVIKLKYEQI